MRQHADLWQWRAEPDVIEPVEPRPLAKHEWPPNYAGVYAWRLQQLQVLRDPIMAASAKAYYKTRYVEFVLDWMDTYDPRQPRNKWMPFILFEKQAEVLQFIHECFTDGESGLVEKCRDAGVTWLSCAYSVWRWLFVPEDAIGWGSRKQDLVDRIGDSDSIFEKLRLLVSRLPPCFVPVGFNPSDHATYMKLINPENGSMIAGEAGDNIGRGGRKSGYFKDESAHYPRPDLVEASLGDNTNTQIDISSVNGLGNVFHRRRENGIEWQPGAKIPPGFVRVMIVDWRDHPAKTQEWYDTRKAKFEREGLQHIFAQEVDRNYAAAVLNTLIDPVWIKASIDAHLRIPWLTVEMLSGAQCGALDVAGEDKEGNDRNAFVRRAGFILRHAQEWGERDPGVSTRHLVADCREFPGIKVQYDSIGLGESVRSEYNRLCDEKIVHPNDIGFVSWNAGAGPQMPYEHIIPDDDKTPINQDFFANLKAQGWWHLRSLFYKTWRAVQYGDRYRPDELISIDSTIPLLRQIEKELAQPVRTQNTRLQMLVDKKPKGMRSPNIADSIMMCYFPIIESSGYSQQGTIR